MYHIFDDRNHGSASLILNNRDSPCFLVLLKKKAKSDNRRNLLSNLKQCSKTQNPHIGVNFRVEGSKGSCKQQLQVSKHCDLSLVFFQV